MQSLLLWPSKNYLTICIIAFVRLTDLNNNDFVKLIFLDGQEELPTIDFKPGAIEIPENVELDEYQYYIHNVGFHVVHMLTWCKQLEHAIEFLSNYDYSKKISPSRADHLIYNVENYLIRLNSVYDRVLQVVNAVFHIGTDEQDVTHAVIVNNKKVQHRPNIHKSIKAFRKLLEKYAHIRNTIIHKHSFMGESLRRIELFYLQNLDDLPENDPWKKEIKQFRARRLKEYLIVKKTEFSELNGQLAVMLDRLFSELISEYKKQKAILK